MLILHEPEYPGLRRVISGGQTGADQGGIMAAKAWGIQTGGVVPSGFRTQSGPAPWLGTEYGLIEDGSFAYPPRTRRNVSDADGTLIVASNPDSPGCAMTARFAAELGRPCFVARLEGPDSFLDSAPQVLAWLRQYRIQVLNVAGNRDRTGTMHRIATFMLVDYLLRELKNLNLLQAQDDII